VYGKYLGSDNTNPSQKFTVEIFAGYKNGYYTTDSLKNLPNSCTNRSATLSSGTAFEFAIYGFLPSNGQSFPTPNCVFREYDRKVGYLQPNRKEIVIEYEFTDKFQKDESLQKRVFKGIKQ
jgi:hypothetical protein